jgi:hypothetical protein
MKLCVYDVECYPNFFCVRFKRNDYSWQYVFEISEWVNQAEEICTFITGVKNEGFKQVGFNNVGYDYHLLHLILKMGKFVTHQILYEKNQSIFATQSEDAEPNWNNYIKPSDRLIPQIDLFKIHHFDNKARMTGLKALEFAMQAESIEELPFPPGTVLTYEQSRKVIYYNGTDVGETFNFAQYSLDKIKFREELIQQDPGKDWLNFSDGKIGREFFISRLEKAGVECYTYGGNGRQPKQTPRSQIVLKDAILPYISFETPEFQRVLDFLKSQTIAETKGVFQELTACVKGFDFDFGTGGIHGSLKNKVVESCDKKVLVDIDVKSYYPNLGIRNGFYPEHLGKDFPRIYEELYNLRVAKPKDKYPAENAMLKLALNVPYGDSNSEFSVFYDPLYTMKITLNGQLLLCKLVEMFWEKEPDAELIQINTDGMTFRIDRNKESVLRGVVSEWEQVTKLEMEFATYSKMFIRDVNNYIAVYENGKIKRKGAYEYQMSKDGGTLDWNQDHSSLVVQKVAEQALVYGKPIRETIENWPNLMDFMIRAKVPKSSYLVIELESKEYKLPNLNRVYVAKGGGRLFKWMPPLKKNPDQWRKIGFLSGWGVQVCNDLKVLKNNPLPVDYDYYVRECEKLVFGLE